MFHGKRIHITLHDGTANIRAYSYIPYMTNVKCEL